MSRTLYTIGYEGYNTFEFVNKLNEYGTQGIFDVREIPNRREAISRMELSQLLLANELICLRIELFRNPMENLYSVGTTEIILKKYGEYIRSLDRNELKEITDWIIGTADVCLLCHERDPMKCHRSVLADYLAELNPELTVVHL